MNGEFLTNGVRFRRDFSTYILSTMGYLLVPLKVLHRLIFFNQLLLLAGRKGLTLFSHVDIVISCIFSLIFQICLSLLISSKSPHFSRFSTIFGAIGDLPSIFLNMTINSRFFTQNHSKSRFYREK